MTSTRNTSWRCFSTSYAKDIALPGPAPAANAHVACEYRVDPDFTATDQIVDHRVTTVSQGAHVDLTLARVQTSAKFKATYHVFWSTEPSDAAGACKAVG